MIALRSDFRIAYSLRARILSLVLVGVALPLMLVGAWTVRSSSRAAEHLVESQLDSVLERAVATAADRWMERRSDVRLLAENEPIVDAMSEVPNERASLPPFVREAFSGMPRVDSVVFRDADGRARWSLANDASAAASTERPFTPPNRGPALMVRVPIHSHADTPAVGEVEASVLESTLLVSEPGAEALGQPVVALRDRASGRWILRDGLPPRLLDSARFAWKGMTWATRRRSLTDPPVDIVASGPLDPISHPLERTARLDAIALIVVASLVIVLATIGTARLTDSLARLATVADIVSRGDLSPTAKVESNDEVGRVAHAFNGMMDTLRRMMRERSQQEALAAVGELAATIAHQVRTPLTSMKLDLQRAEEALPSGGPLAKTLVLSALDGLGRLDVAVDASLRIARTGSGRFAPLDLRGAIEIARAAVGPRAVARGIQLSSIEGEPISVQGDEAALVQMLTNVLINAIEAARTEVTIAAEALPEGGARIRIRDDGAGIGPEVMPRVGEPFFSTKPGGTGLGLAIAKRVATAHGGELTIESVAGSGTLITIVLGG